VSIVQLHQVVRRFSPAVLVVAALTWPAAAHANGRFPASSQLVLMPGNPSVMALRTTFGLLFSADHASSWYWTCEKAVGYGGVEDPMLGITATGTILAGMFEGLASSPDTGCSWSLVGGGLTKQVVIDLVVRPDTPSTALALTSTYAGDGGLILFHSQLFITTDGGSTWSPHGMPIDPTLLTETVEVAASDPHRIYVTGIRGQGAMTTASLMVSYDDGMTWMDRPIPLDLTVPERGAYIAGVDPNTPDRVYVRTTGETSNMMTSGRLLVTANAGMAFSAAYTATVTGSSSLPGFALSADGSKVYVGNADGLMIAPSSTMAFTKQSSIQVQCLTVSGTTLYACSNEVSGFILGSSTDDGASWTPLLHLTTMCGPLTCPAGSSSTQCQPNWPALAASLGAPIDAGCGAAGDAGPPPPKPAPGKGCGGCSEASQLGGSAAALAALAAILALAIRRRKA
jgi:hypothetical protein